MRVLQRRGADIRVSTPVRSIERRARAPRERDHRRRHNRSRRRHRAQRHRQRDACRPRPAWPDRCRRDDAEPQSSAAYGRWVTAPTFQDRTAARIRRWPSTPSARRDISRATWTPSSKGARRRRSSFDRSARWPRSDIRARSHALRRALSRVSRRGGSVGLTTCSRCRAGIVDCASSSTGPWHSSSPGHHQG